MAGLDRRIVVRTTVTATDDQGRPLEPVHTDRPVWAQRMDKDAMRVVEEGGSIGIAKMVFRVRYREDIVAAAETGVAKVLVDGLELRIENLVTAAETGPLRERRRFLELEVHGSTS